MPEAGAALSNIGVISAGFWHSCAVTSEGAASCWGDSGYGQLGGGEALRTTPGAVVELLPAAIFATYLPLVVR